MIKVIEKIDDKIDLIQMKNDDLEVVVSNYGCTIVKVLMKDKDGNIDDVVLGYDDFRDYQTVKLIRCQLIMVLIVYMVGSKVFHIRYLIIKYWRIQLSLLICQKMVKRDILVI